MPEDPAAPGEGTPLLQTVQRSERDNTTVVIAPEICHSHSSSSIRNLRREPSAGSNAPSCSSNSAPVLGTCRICFETDTSPSQDPANPLICPCMCSGSSKYVHRQCLEQWRNTNHRADAFWQCEVCKYKYQYRRLQWAGLLGSKVTLAVLYVLLMSSLIAVLGFIPVLNILPKGPSSSSGGSGGGSGGDTPSSPSPSPDPAGGGDSQVPQSMWALVSLHVANGLVMIGLLGLLLFVVLAVLRCCGVTVPVGGDLALCGACAAPDCGGFGFLPFYECGAAGECGVAFLGVLAVVALVLGIVMAAYTLYALLLSLLQQGLDKAQYMVENVQQDQEAAAGGSGDAKQRKSSSADDLDV